MGFFAILMFVAFGLIPLAGILLAFESWGRAKVVPWVFAWSPWTIRTVRDIQRITPPHRDGRILSGEAIHLRKLTDGRCFFVQSNSTEFPRLSGETDWTSATGRAEAIGRVSLGSLCVMLSLLVYGLFALTVALGTARNEAAVLLSLLAGAGGVIAVVLGLVYTNRGLRARLDRDLEEADALIRNDARFHNPSLARFQGLAK